MASILWVDDDGPAMLTNGKPAPADKLNAWTPDREPVGPSVTGVGTGRIHVFRFRTDTTVQFQLDAIPGTTANMELMLRLKEHLMLGGVISLDAEPNPMASTFGTASLQPDTKPQIDFSDRQMYEYSFIATLRASDPGDTDVLSPAFIPGLRLWLRADSLTLDDEDFISTWLDSSGNDYHAVQADSTRQPRYAEGAFGDNPGVEVDAGVGGSGDYMLTPTIINPCTLGSAIYLLAKQSGAQTEHGNILGLPDTTGENASDNRIYGTSNDVEKLFWTNPGVELGTPITTGFILELAIASASSITPNFNGVAGSAFDPHDSINQLKRVCVGRDHISGNSSNCTVGQILEYEGVPSSTNRAYVRNYLSAWSGIALA